MANSNIKMAVSAALLLSSSLAVSASKMDPQKRYSSFADSHQNALLGDPKAQVAIAQMYLKGDVITKDAKQGAQWLQVAADNGDAEAQVQLALLYASGTGVYRDKALAVAWLGKAAKQNNSHALDLLHWMSQAAH